MSVPAFVVFQVSSQGAEGSSMSFLHKPVQVQWGQGCVSDNQSCSSWSNLVLEVCFSGALIGVFIAQRVPVTCYLSMLQV